MKRENLVVFVGGRKGSGKNYLLDRHFSRHAPRIIRLDFAGDVSEKWRDVPEAIGYDGVLAKLRHYARVCPQRSALIGVFDDARMDEVQALFSALVPRYAGRSTPPGIARGFGGIAVECGECDLILPNSSDAFSAPARNAVKRGRHERLSLYLATQRPQECSRLCTSQADVIISFATKEPREIEYWSRGAGSEFAARVQRLPRYHSLWLDRRGGTDAIAEIDARGEKVVPQLFDGP